MPPTPTWPRQKRSVETILHELGVDGKPTIPAFNKIDLRAPDAEPEIPNGAVRFSAKTGEGIDGLRERIIERLAPVAAPA